MIMVYSFLKKCSSTMMSRFVSNNFYFNKGWVCIVKE